MPINPSMQKKRIFVVFGTQGIRYFFKPFLSDVNNILYR